MTINFTEENIYLRHIRDAYCGHEDRLWSDNPWELKALYAVWGTFNLSLILGMFVSLFVGLPAIALGFVLVIWEAVSK